MFVGKEFVGRTVKLVYTDDGRDRAIPGTLRAITEDGFAVLDDLNGTTHVVATKRIIHLAVLNEG